MTRSTATLLGGALGMLVGYQASDPVVGAPLGFLVGVCLTDFVTAIYRNCTERYPRR